MNNLFTAINPKKYSNTEQIYDLVLDRSNYYRIKYLKSIVNKHKNNC